MLAMGDIIHFPNMLRAAISMGHDWGGSRPAGLPAGTEPRPYVCSLKGRRV